MVADTALERWRRRSFQLLWNVWPVSSATAIFRPHSDLMARRCEKWGRSWTIFIFHSETPDLVLLA